MVTDAIMSAVQGMVDQFDTPEKKEAGEQIYNMLAEFDEDKWSALVDPGEVTEWLRQFIGREDHSSDHVFTVYKKAATFEKKVLTFPTEEEALQFCKDYNWQLTDENGFVWDLCYKKRNKTKVTLV